MALRISPKFRDSLLASAELLRPFLKMKLMDLSENEYADAVSALWPCYRALRLTVAGATVVVNSKALYHVLPDFIPPIDRQYTLRFFSQAPAKWRDAKGAFKPIMLPGNLDAQFQLFQSTCVKVKCLADRVERDLLDEEQREHGVSAPKAIDNAIVNYVRIVARTLGPGQTSRPPV